MSGPLLLPTWAELGVRPQVVATMRRYLEQIGCVLRPGSVNNADQALRAFAAFLVETAPEVTSTTQVTRRHIEGYKPWLASRPGQNKARVTIATLAHRLGTLRTSPKSCWPCSPGSAGSVSRPTAGFSARPTTNS